MQKQWIFIGLAFFLGSLPFGYWLGRLRGIDVRGEGSRNTGATNVGRVLGKKWGILVLVLDVAKGWVAVALAEHVGKASDPLVVTVGVVAVLGHIFSPWLGFRGGKGVATSAGVLLALTPIVGLSVIGVFAAVFFLGRIVSVASLVAATAFPFLVLGLDPGRPILQWAAVGMGVLVWVRHWDNLIRLLQGKESGFPKK
ncbi:MAG: glycerol-3-phosphate 1-O-acyltransferase PlsY [Verrucomicrobia bacterium]|nr:glycerol-3-phosphate 1-O-acyltransferase PlsY [Verrucomicrobiota bacterium]